MVSSAEEGLVGGKGVPSYSPPTWLGRHQYIGIVRASRAFRVTASVGFWIAQII